LFGARRQDLSAIWGALVAAGMESGHAYSMSLRTVEICVGSSWWRYGVGDSTGTAIRLEECYKSIRGPYKFDETIVGCHTEAHRRRYPDYVQVRNHVFPCLRPRR